MTVEERMLVVQDKVRRYLGERGHGLSNDPWTTAFRSGSSRVFVSLRPYGDRWTTIEIAAGLLFGAPASEALCRYVAMQQAGVTFGTLRLKESALDDELVDVWLEHVLLGDFLDREELRVPLAEIASVADRLDDELRGRFGGRRYYDDVP
jgi:hypothetical protein